MPCLVILQNSSWQQPARMWQQPSKNFWCGNSVFCDLSIWTPKTTFLCINPCDLLSFEKAMLSCWPDSEAMPQAARWQSMPAGETVWQIFAVFHMVFKESDCCQLGLGDWLASQSPNQVDSREVANSRWQAAKIWLIHGQVPRAALAPHAKQYGFLYGFVQELLGIMPN